MGLMYAQYPNKQVVRRACDLIMSCQQPVIGLDSDRVLLACTDFCA